LRVGVDIDGVLADSLPLWVAEMNDYFKKNRQLEDIRLFDLCTVYEVTEEEVLRFMQLKGRELMIKPPPMEGAVFYLQEIKKHHEIYIVTARDPCYEEETRWWLQKYGLLFDNLLLLGSHAKQGACLECKLNILVEDTLEVSLRVSAAGVPVILLDAPYNRSPLPELIIRKRSWAEIYQVLNFELEQLVVPTC